MAHTVHDLVGIKFAFKDQDGKGGEKEEGTEAEQRWVIYLYQPPP